MSARNPCTLQSEAGPFLENGASEISVPKNVPTFPRKNGFPSGAASKVAPPPPTTAAKFPQIIGNRR